MKESGITYNNTKLEYSKMDNKFARSQRYIGESSNLAQLAMSYYWTEPSKELYDNVVILAVIAQVVIDGIKREYEIDALEEIERIKKMKCMTIKKNIYEDERHKTIKYDLPFFMKYTKEVAVTKNGRELPYSDIKNSRNKIKRRLNPAIVCPMNWLQEALDKIQGLSNDAVIDTKYFFNKINGTADNRHMSKIRKYVEEYDNFVRNSYFENDEDYMFLKLKTEELVNNVRKFKTKNTKTFNRLIETALGLESHRGIPYKEAIKHSRRMLNTLYKVNRNLFLMNFTANLLTFKDTDN